jgi:hypothetical protein
MLIRGEVVGEAIILGVGLVWLGQPPLLLFDQFSVGIVD